MSIVAKFLQRIMDNDQDLVAFLQRAVGYSLSGKASERAIFILHGGGKNGKTTFVETVRALLGADYAARIQTDTLMVKKAGAASK